MTETDLDERLAQLIDRCDNFLSAAALPVPDSIHVLGLKHGIESIRAELLAIFLERGGVDIWDVPL